jgi:hypothetical protein
VLYGGHCSALNCTKTELLCPDAPTKKLLAGKLLSVDGEIAVKPRDRGYTIRYLGMWINLNLAWKDQINRMTRTVFTMCATIKRGKFTLPMSAFAITQFLLPRLRTGLRSASISPTTLRSWDTQIRQAVCHADGIRTQHIKADCFYLASGVPSVEDQSHIIRGESLMVSLNSNHIIRGESLMVSLNSNHVSSPIPLFGCLGGQEGLPCPRHVGSPDGDWRGDA